MSSRENLNPQALSRIAREVQKMVTDTQLGIRFILNERDITDIQADIEGPVGTPYEGGVFRCKLVIGSEFPAAPPKGFFLTKTFHPNVSTSGDICVNTLKKDWNPDMGLLHVLQVIRCLLIVPFPESALNEEASRLFLESYDEYARRATLMTSIHAMPVVSNTKQKLDDAIVDSSDNNGNESENPGQPAPAKVAKTMLKKKSSSRSALKRL